MLNIMKKIANTFLPVRPPEGKVDPDKSSYTRDQMITSHKGFTVGDKVIVISNEDEPYMVGHITSYMLVGKNNHPLPLVKVPEFEEPMLCFSHLEPHSEALCSILDQLNNIEQWNLVVHDHAQLKSHRGKSYKTFQCRCNSCTEIRNMRNGEST